MKHYDSIDSEEFLLGVMVVLPVLVLAAAVAPQILLVFAVLLALGMIYVAVPLLPVAGRKVAEALPLSAYRVMMPRTCARLEREVRAERQRMIDERNWRWVMGPDPFEKLPTEVINGTSLADDFNLDKQLGWADPEPVIRPSDREGDRGQAPSEARRRDHGGVPYAGSDDPHAGCRDASAGDRKRAQAPGDRLLPVQRRGHVSPVGPAIVLY